MSVRKQLADYLCKVNKQEIFLQNIRQTIATNPYFQTLSAFQRFDKFRKGQLVPTDFVEFMYENQIYPSELQLYLIFRDFDKERLGVITLDKFEDQILPRENKKLKKDALSRKPYPVDLRLQIDLQFIVAKYFEAKIKHIKELDFIRKQMHCVRVYSSEQAFCLIDNSKNGYISNIQQIDRFLRQNGNALKHEDLVRIFRALNFNRDGHITYQSFQQHIEPFSNGLYSFYKYKPPQSQLQMVQHSKLRNNIQRAHLDNSILQNQRREDLAIQDLANLRQSNRRLQHIIHEQDRQAYLYRESRYNPYRYI